MPVKSDTKPKVSVGDAVTIEMEGEELECKVSKIKASGNIVVEDAEGSTYECEAHEVKPTKAKKKKADDDNDDDDNDKPKAKKKAEDDDDNDNGKDKTPATAKALGWGKAKPAEKKSLGFPIGNWEALAFNGGVEQDGKKLSTYIEFVGVGDDAVNGKTQRVYYQLADEEAEPLDGITYFKRDLLLLGYTEDQLDAVDEDDLVEDLTKLLKKLRKMETWVSVKAKEKKGYINLFLNGPMDDQDDKPKNPLAGVDRPY